MKRRTIVLVGVFGGLLLLLIMVKLWPEKGPGPDLVVPGWGSGAKVEKSEEEGPIDKIVVEMNGETATLRRLEKGKWAMDPPEGARADKWKVRQIIDAFRDGFTSVISSRVNESNLAAFGLDKENVIRLALYRGDMMFTSLDIGSVRKPDDGIGEGDTFVREPGSERVYRLIGKDLRRPFETGIKGLRDRRVHDWESDDVVAFTIKNPKAQRDLDKVIVLRSEAKETLEEPGQGDKKKVEREWRFEKPAGIRAGNVKSYTATLASIYAQEYVDSMPEGVSIGEDALRIEVELADGRKVKMAVSEIKDDSAYVMVEGSPGYAKVSKYTAESLAKKVSDLRDKTFFAIKREEIVGVRIVDGASRVEVARHGEGWKAVEPAGWPVGKAAMDTLLRDLETLQAKDIMSEEEAKGVDTGLSKPSTTVTLRTTDGQVLTLKIGRELEKEKGTYYASVSSSPDLYTIASWMAQRVRKGVRDLRNKTVFDFSADRVKVIEIARVDETLRLERKDGEALAFRATAPTQADDLKEEKVKLLVNTLAGLTAKEIVEGKSREAVGLSGKARLEVTVVLDDGSKHLLRLSEQNQQGDPYAETPTEADMKGTIFTLNQYQVKNFDKRLDELR